MGTPTVEKFKSLLKMNMIKNCPVTLEDIEIAEDIYGPDVSTLRGKTTRKKPLPAIKDYVEIPKELKAAHEYVELSADIMYINGITFLVTISKRIKYITVHCIKDRSKETVEDAFDKVFRNYNTSGFYISKIYTDPEFTYLEEDMKDNDIIMEFAAAQAHVPDIEQTIRTLKERFRCQYNRIPYRRIPKLMVDILAQECARWLNMFPPNGGASTYYSPLAIISGRIIDYKKHCGIVFGSYVEAGDENDPTNTIKSRTIGCIYLRPRFGDNVVYELMNLRTGQLITRRRVTEVAITDTIIQQVEKLAEKDGMKTDLTFKDRKGFIEDKDLLFKEVFRVLNCTLQLHILPLQHTREQDVFDDIEKLTSAKGLLEECANAICEDRLDVVIRVFNRSQHNDRRSVAQTGKTAPENVISFQTRHSRHLLVKDD